MRWDEGMGLVMDIGTGYGLSERRDPSYLVSPLYTGPFLFLSFPFLLLTYSDHWQIVGACVVSVYGIPWAFTAGKPILSLSGCGSCSPAHLEGTSNTNE